MLSLVTFNMRCPVPGDGVNYLPFRLPMIVREIREKQPDIIGFQEMEGSGYEALRLQLPQYQFEGVGRNADLKGESCRIAYKRDRLSMIALNHFWLSPTPDRPGTRFEEQSNCPRICTWGKFFDHETQAFFYVINTHLDHRGQKARELGLQLVLNHAQSLLQADPLPLFILGDFNFKPQDPEYSLIAQSPFHDLTAQLTDTFHGFGKRETPIKIDYILSNASSEDFTIRAWHTCQDGVYLSDHDAVEAQWRQTEA